MDSSSLILLTKSNLLIKVLDKNTLSIPEAVYEESVGKGIEKGFVDAYQIERLKTEGKIIVKKADKNNLAFIENTFMLHQGEKEAVALAYELKTHLIIDDRKGRNAAKILEIKLTSALGILEALVDKKKIKKEDGLNALSILEKEGWYKEELINKIKNKLMGDQKC